MGYVRLNPGGDYSYVCIRCGHCCSTGPNISLTGYDVIRLASYRGVHWADFIRLYTNVIVADVFPFVALTGVGKGICPFLRRDSGVAVCSVYDARPMRCRLYPLTLLSPSPSGLRLDAKCRGVGKGDRLRVPTKLIKHYSWELSSYYSALFDLILKEGRDPLEALHTVLNGLWKAARHERPRWFDLKFLENLGST